MTLKDLQKELEELIGVYGEDCPVKSFYLMQYVNKDPYMFYDEDEDAVIIH